MIRHADGYVTLDDNEIERWRKPRVVTVRTIGKNPLLGVYWAIGTIYAGEVVVWAGLNTVRAARHARGEQRLAGVAMGIPR